MTASVSHLPSRVPPAPPTGLGEQGTRLWTSVVEYWDLRADELAVLRQAARTADELALIDTALADAPSLIVDGSRGQPAPHPLLAEARGHRQLLGRLLASLGLHDDDPDSAGGEAGRRSAAGRALARHRWG